MTKATVGSRPKSDCADAVNGRCVVDGGALTSAHGACLRAQPPVAMQPVKPTEGNPSGYAAKVYRAAISRAPGLAPVDFSGHLSLARP